MKKFTLYSLIIILGLLFFSVLAPALASNEASENSQKKEKVEPTQNYNYSYTYFTSNNRQHKFITTYLELKNKKGEVIGVAGLVQMGKHVIVKINAAGLTPGIHGFHIHENWISKNDFATAGGHYNPNSKEHGHENPNGSNLGDLPNLTVDKDGKIDQAIVLEGLSLDKDVENSILGKSLIIHEKADDGKTNPAGNSGDRVAGGNIAQ